MTSADELFQRHTSRGPVPPPEGATAVPTLKAAVLTCMDARIDVYSLLGLEPGEAHVLRNGGGVVTDDVIRSLALSQHKLGTEEVLVVQHTSCGVSTVTEDGFKDELEAATGVRPTWSVEAFDDVEASVRRGVERVRHSEFLPHRDKVRGFVLDIDKGSLTELV
ncbi:carbonic anhydrase [Amycolatopsis rhabdoformis]|uniref:carbonic anhydrase n=1 Tax=Amycolatopsis rhabdoformis TaxID=1448059 RepID=A0ABZ1I0I1_9PSEU|nr:carbonic anhydrase [Amycolatopsis rhabdoformis]WSE27710.1 carbonic anhydrase [Amycolatopsis rhabdoformis]